MNIIAVIPMYTEETRVKLQSAVNKSKIKNCNYNINNKYREY